ncbi:MAG: LamG-like jellyroll fold domain-containing protein [Akkermansiaceae bacterium]
MTPPELPSQIQRMLDGELSPGELTALESELRENEEARELYRKLATLHSDLEMMHSGQSTLIKKNIVPFDLVAAKERKKIFKGAMIAAAAVLIISMLVLHFTRLPEQPIASFRTTPAADFSLTHDVESGEAPVGQVLAVGSKLHLRKGTLESTFSSGVRVVIEAPCIMRVLADDQVAVDEGVAWFEVPEKAVGFTVETPEMTVVDLGTAFGVDSSPEIGDDEVHVTRGAVEVTARIDGGKSETLREGEARQVTKIGELKAININTDHFTTSLPINEGLNQGLIGHWDFENTVYNSHTDDTSGNGHTGILQGDAEIVADPVRGNVLSLSGIQSSKDMVDIDSIKNIPNLLAHRGLTLAAWIKRNPNSSSNLRYAYVIGLGQEGDHPIATLGVYSGVVDGFIEGEADSQQAQITGDTPVTDGVWTHIAITIDRMENLAVSYVNGVPQASPTDISAVDDGELDWEFGKIGRTLGTSHTQYFAGLIDDVRVYDRPLTAAEIADLAN